MTLGEIISLVVRPRIADENSVTFSDVQIRRAVNLSAAFVAREITLHSGRVLYSRGTYSFTTTTALAYELTSATDFRRVWKMFRTDIEEEAVEIAEPDKYTGSNIDDLGRWVYFLTRDASTGLFSVNFPLQPPSGMTFRVIYEARTPSLATDGSADSSSYTSIDADYHELIGARAAVLLLGPDGANYDSALMYYNELLRSMVASVTRGANKSNVIDEVS